MATANNIGQLPTEFLRAGRFDTIFFVDLPSREERIEILEIMNAKYGAAIPTLQAADAASGFTGAEIEQLAKDSLFDGYETAIQNVVPLSRSIREEVSTIRDWAKTRARIANSPEPDAAEVRKIRTG